MTMKRVAFLLSAGTVGDWKHYFTNKQNRLFDEMYNTKMDSSSLAAHILYES